MPRRILMTADTVGGVWTYALDLAEALSCHGVQVTIATMGTPLSEEQWDQACRIPELSVRESSYKLEWMQEPWEDILRAGQWLMGLERDIAPDIVHLNGYVHASLPWHAPKLVVGHSCVLSWWSAVNGTQPPECWNRYGDEVCRGLHSADMVVAPSRAMLGSLCTHYGAFRRARVIPNGRKAGIFLRSPKEPFILTAGRIWDLAKNVEALERVSCHLPWPVYVAGDEQHPDGWRTSPCGAHRLGLLSPLELSQWFARASIYALPARYEPFGLTVLEAALAGCCLVLGDIPSLRENWDGAALFVKPDDSDSLMAALHSLIEGPETRLLLGEKARARAAALSAERMAEDYLDVYRDLMMHSGSKFSAD